MQWNRTRIDQAKQKIKERLSREGAPSAQLSFALGQVRLLSESESSSDQLKAFVYLIYALLFFRRLGRGLNGTDLKHLSEIGLGILRRQKIRPNTSRRSFLYQDLHMALSQAYWSRGLFSDAAWESEAGLRLTLSFSRQEKGYHYLTRGLFLLRTGAAVEAEQAFESAEKCELSPQHRALLIAERSRILRWSGRSDEAEALIEVALKDKSLFEFRAEVVWQRVLLRATDSGDLFPLMQAISRKHSHHRQEYILQAYLLSRTIAERKWLIRYPRLSAIRGSNLMRKGRRSPLLQAVDLLDDCYDFSLPLHVRLQHARKLGEIAGKVPSAEQELLIWGALARFLTRIKNPGLAQIALSRYRLLSLGLSKGSSGDALACLGDLVSKSSVRSFGEEENLSYATNRAEAKKVRLSVISTPLRRAMK